MRQSSNLKITLINIFLGIWLPFEKRGLNLIKIPKIKPDKKTLLAFELLKKIYNEAEKKNIKVWLVGSWALTGRVGHYFKNIDDIDFTMRKRKEEKLFSSLLKSLGLIKKGKSPMGASKYVEPNSKLEIDFGSITYPYSAFYQLPLNENETVIFKGFEFKVIPKKSHLDIYKYILLKKGRNLKEDLAKIKILAIY